MLYFYKNNDKLGDLIQNELEEMCAAHLVMQTSEPSHIIENEVKIIGKDPIMNFLSNFHKMQALPHSISADSCRIDPDTGEVC